MEDTVGQPGGGSASAGPTMTVTVKTLDSNNHEFTVAEDMLVRDFKIEITEKVGIPADQQRLIFRGRVLQDDKKMGECNVANSTIHVVQRPANSSRTNDEPPPAPAGGRMPDGMQGGLIIAAQTGPIPNFGPRGSASARLQASNHMLARASTFLRRLEEQESINLGGADPAPTPSVTAPGPAPNNNASASAGSDMDIDDGDEGWDDSGSFGNMISQMATAATAASLAGMQGNIQTPAATTTAPIGGAVSLGPAGILPGGVATANTSRPASGTNTPNHSARRPESPRLEEMAAVIEGIISFNERLTPYLRFLQNALRTNRQYINVEEQRSVQYLFDTLSSTMHYMSHSYHALSDMICDFSTPASTRRLRAATAVVLETSTMLRASIPIGVPVGFVAPGGVINPQAQQPLQPQNSTQPQPAAPPAPPVGGTPTPPNLNAGVGQNQNLVQAVSAQIAQMFGQGAGGQGAGGGLGLGGGQFNLGNLGHGNFEAQIHVGIDNGMDGGGGGGGGGVINIQDLAQMFGSGGGLMMQQQSQGQHSGGNWQAHSMSAAPPPQQGQGLNQTQPPQQQPAGTPSYRNNNGGVPGGHVPTPIRVGVNPNNGGVNNNNFRLQQGGPFDVLVPCNSHHGWRTNPGPRPPMFTQHVDVQRVQEPSLQGQGFLSTLINVLLQSNILSTLQPMANDIIVNYLMRGRDAKNKEHVKSCAKKLNRNIVPFFETFSNNISTREMNVDYTETYASIITEFLTEVIHLTALCPSEPYQYHSAVVSAGDRFGRQLVTIFQYCFKDLPGNGFEGFAEYIVDNFFRCSLLMQDEIRRTVTDYFKRHAILGSPTTTSTTSCPPIVQLKKEIKTHALAGTSGTGFTPSSPATGTTRPVTSLSKSSPDVLPPKQAKPSEHMMGEDDLDDFLDLQPASGRSTSVNVSTAPLTPNSMLSGGGAFGPPNMEAALRNIPSEWVEAVRRDMHLQWGMPEQPPLSPAYCGIFSKKSQ